MHPNAAFRRTAGPDGLSGDEAAARALHEALIAQVGFGMVFLPTPDGPRVAHTPLLSTGDGAVQFHLARGNALTRHLDGANALALINGPDAYVSPRWYAAADQVPTWNYVALELEGRVRKMERDGLIALLEALSARQEALVTDAGAPWTMAKMAPAPLGRMLDAIVGFELEIAAWRPTFKLSQNKPADERARVIAGLEAQGSVAMAQLMRNLAG
ncbi:FMN-binding negative transcriptional regulator [Novosphingobium sp. FKTRR1]|uniref:FMN-binding negative transcriptional regulator n=1 Tax=Novosphingobium sp. FKTRR1 TaxID=2879118 RepID=UPI001CF0B3C1|nr:FMN-binding negative transcriptional regulator [Novosphingobium sp. FKTRR1]